MTKPNMKSRKPGSFASSLPIEDAQCIRNLSFEFSYMPLEKNSSVENALDTVYSYLRAPYAHTLRCRDGGDLSPVFNPITLKKSGNVIVSVIRKAFDGEGAILRVYEAMGKEGWVTVSSDIFTKFELVTMNEDHPVPVLPDENGRIHAELRPHKIITIMMKES